MVLILLNSISIEQMNIDIWQSNNFSFMKWLTILWVHQELQDILLKVPSFLSYPRAQEGHLTTKKISLGWQTLLCINKIGNNSIYQFTRSKGLAKRQRHNLVISINRPSFSHSCNMYTDVLFHKALYYSDLVINLLDQSPWIWALVDIELQVQRIFKEIFIKGF